MTSSTSDQAEPAVRDRTDRRLADSSQPAEPPRPEAWPQRQGRRIGPRRFDDLF